MPQNFPRRAIPGLTMGWFDTKDLTARAGALATEYQRHRAAAAATATDAGKRYQRVRDDAVAYSATLGWNLYKKSRFFQALRAGLLARAVPEAEAEEFVRSVMLGPLVAAQQRKR